MVPSSTTRAAKATGALASASPLTASKISTIIFDVDDTLYDVSSGFTKHRNGDLIRQYMVDHYGFASLAAAGGLRDEYFARYHSTAKALTVAQAEGRFPDGCTRTFDAAHMAMNWVENCDYDLLWGNHAYPSVEESRRAKTDFRAALAKCPAHLVVFSNGPRAYVKKVLDTLGYLELFGTDRRSRDGACVWGVDDVLPHCKPEAAAFQSIFDKLAAGSGRRILPEECVMVEDSMKNVRAAKALGMRTILITGSREEGRILQEDAPRADDPAVDVAFATVEEMVARLPGLWQDPPVFDP